MWNSLVGCDHLLLCDAVLHEQGAVVSAPALQQHKGNMSQRRGRKETIGRGSRRMGVGGECSACAADGDGDRFGGRHVKQYEAYGTCYFVFRIG
jgi:hypothetical protein